MNLRNITARAWHKTGILFVFSVSVFCLNACNQTTVKPGSLGNGYKGIAWGSSPAEVVKALKITPVHNTGDVFQKELGFETDSEWRYYTFCKERLCSVEVRRKVPRSDSLHPEILNNTLQDLTKEYGLVAPAKGESLYKWNDGETVIQYDADNGAYKSGYIHGIGPEVCYKSLSVWKIYLSQWRKIAEPKNFNGCVLREIPFFYDIPAPNITVRPNSLGNGYEGIRWGVSAVDVIKILGINPRPKYESWMNRMFMFETKSKSVYFEFSSGGLYRVDVTFKVPPSDSPQQDVADGVLKELIKQCGKVAPQRRESRYIWNDGETQIEYDTDNETYRIGCKFGTGPRVSFRSLWLGLPPSVARK